MSSARNGIRTSFVARLRTTIPAAVLGAKLEANRDIRARLRAAAGIAVRQSSNGFSAAFVRAQPAGYLQSKMAHRTVQAKLQRFYWRAERRIAPGLEYSQHQYERELRGMVPQGARWLDLGCGHRLLPEWRGEEESSLVAKADQIVGLDPDFHSLRKHRSIKQRVLGDASHLPFRDGAFDLVTANMVVEHLPAPVEQFGEVYRVLDSGGRFVFHTPNLYGHATALARLVPESLKGTLVRVLDGRAEEDRFRTYYQCNTRAAVVAIAERAGFHLESIDFLASSAAFALIPPLALLELGWIRLTMRRFPGLRATLLVTLVRPPA